MVMQVFRGDDDGDNVPANVTGPSTEEDKRIMNSGRRWFLDDGPKDSSVGETQKVGAAPSPHFLKFASRRPTFDFSEPKPA